MYAPSEHRRYERLKLLLLANNKDLNDEELWELIYTARLERVTVFVARLVPAGAVRNQDKVLKTLMLQRLWNSENFRHIVTGTEDQRHCL